jgi:hypothetical protein
MTIKQFHDSARQLMNIGQHQYMPPEDIDLQLNNAITDTWRQEYKHFEATQEISDTLGFYKKISNPIVLDEFGQGDLPTDYYHITGAEAIMDNDDRVECEFLKDGYFVKRKHSVDFGPSETYPIARQIGAKKIEALPGSVKSIVVYYLRKPATAKYGYVINPDGTTWTYSLATSTEVDWPEVGHTMIQDKMLGLLGLSLRDADLMANETRRKNQNEDQ